jgi:response regulator RpfG family c-di-GMP phosphodiesterase
MHKVLLVDDDENILYGYKRNLRSNYQIHIAKSAAEALKLIAEIENLAIVVSDFNMPEMNGIEFLSEVMKKNQNIIRILLTGNADLKVAMTAVNEGNIFRFLTKPCSLDIMNTALTQAVQQYNLLTAEKELLNKTLKGSIKILIDTLSIVNPEAFNQATNSRKLAQKIVRRMGKQHSWEIEMACMLSQIGCVGVPNDIIAKRANCETLTPDEEKLFLSHPEIGKSLLKNIPRLEGIAEAISYQFNDYSGNEDNLNYKIGDNIPFIGRLLRVLNDYLYTQVEGATNKQIMELLFSESKKYDPDILAALEAEVSGATEGYLLRPIAVNQLEAGMILAEGLYDKSGLLLLPNGTLMSELSTIKIRNYAKMNRVKEPVKIMFKK